MSLAVGGLATQRRGESESPNNGGAQLAGASGRDPDFQSPMDRNSPGPDKGWKRVVFNFTPSFVSFLFPAFAFPFSILLFCAILMLIPFHNRHWLIIYLRFLKTKQNRWFSVSMGTGITSVLLLMLPYNGVWVYWISVSVFVLNVVLFGIGTVITLLQFTLYPKVWGVILNDPYQTMFIGCFPIGFATIIDMFVLVCVPAWGNCMGIVAWVFWMIDAAIAAMAAMWLPFLLCVGARLPLLQSYCRDVLGTDQG
jgi:hypothetical protein